MKTFFLRLLCLIPLIPISILFFIASLIIFVRYGGEKADSFISTFFLPLFKLFQE